MASPFLFDLSTFDLSAVAVSAAEVGVINPQAGEMRQLDHLIWIDDARTMGIGVKTVRHDEFWVPLHIPGRPLMPGVLIIEAAAQASSIIFSLKDELKRDQFLGFTRCDQVSFRGQVVPGDTMYLLIREISSRPRRFVTQTQAVVDGKMIFEGQITGMVF